MSALLLQEAGLVYLTHGIFDLEMPGEPRPDFLMAWDGLNMSTGK